MGPTPSLSANCHTSWARSSTDLTDAEQVIIVRNGLATSNKWRLSRRVTIGEPAVMKVGSGAE
jgi:hypothetical protein